MEVCPEKMGSTPLDVMRTVNFFVLYIRLLKNCYSFNLPFNLKHIINV